jgi:hypothetical protein
MLGIGIVVRKFQIAFYIKAAHDGLDASTRKCTSNQASSVRSSIATGVSGKLSPENQPRSI